MQPRLLSNLYFFIKTYLQDGSSPEILLSKSAFKKVIFGDVDDEKEEQPEVTVASEFPADPITLQGLSFLLQDFSCMRMDFVIYRCIRSANSSARDADSVVVRFKVNCSRLERGQSVSAPLASGMMWAPFVPPFC